MKKTVIAIERTLALMLALVMTVTFTGSYASSASAEQGVQLADATDATTEESDDTTEEAVDENKTIITLGADLNASEKATVLSELGVTEDDLKDCRVIEVTNQDEHDYLDDYLSASVIGNRALSSIRLDRTSEGSGIHVTTRNINYCTESMYVNALATAGIKDADVIVAGPFEISGTAGLVGTMKAYEEITGKEISDDVKDAATDELVTTGQIADSIDDPDKASDLIGYVKNEVVSQGSGISKDEIGNIVDKASDEMDVKLSDEDRQKIIDMMAKISKLDLDVNSLQEQAKGLYDKLQGMNLNIDSEKAQGFFEKIVQFFQRLYNKLINSFN